jgi:hypothetical protein
MVEGLSKQITGDWVEITEASLSLNGILDFFKFSEETLASLTRRLAAAAEEGVTEFKFSILGPVFGLLEDMKYKSVNFQELAIQKEEIDKLLFVALIQRLFSSGGLGSAAREKSESAGDAEKDLKMILSDVMARVHDNPQLKNNTAVKLILTQLAIYQRERETMEKLKPNITDKQKADAFRRNFSQTFHKISENIRKYYADLQALERKQEDDRVRISLDRFPLRGLLALFTKQAREFLRIRSTIGFALDGKYKVREICVHIANEKQSYLALIDQEKSAYKKMYQEAGIEKAGRGDELVGLLYAQEIAALIHKAAGGEADKQS